MSIATLGTKSRGMIYGAFKTIGAGCYIPNAHTCPRCKQSRMSFHHKKQCKYNPNPLWI